MFENLSDRIAGTLLMGLDAAVEFATLGEFRVVDHEPALASMSPSTAAAPLARRPDRFRAWDVDRDLLPTPATAIARASRPQPMPERVRTTRVAPVQPVRCDRRRRRGSAPAEPVGRTQPRTRAGAVQPAAQLCLLTD
jgi:hypothetical protein